MLPQWRTSPGLVTAGDTLAARWEALLANVPPGVGEIVSHPAYVDAELRGLSELTDERAVDFAVLADPAARRRLENSGVRLITFQDL
jgi:predicted glycoside hydrolase/deacetylase ChbG (UPF0249 family)